jgi:hypothetical protein
MSVILRRQCLSFFLLLNAMIGAGCSQSPDESAAPRSADGTFDPRPEDPASVEAQLKRYMGQRSFLNISNRYRMPIAEPIGSESDRAKSGAGRAIQEADLFKVGKEGSKLLYVLNPYRGLQVVDFSGGPEAPRLLGRTEATGHDLMEMYFIDKHMQIVVLERRWDSQGGPQSRMAVYTVADPRRPSLMQTIDLPGMVADSRLVGDVLYVASSRWDYSSAQSGQGWVNSYLLGAEGLKEVTSYRLALPVQSMGSMNIVENREKGEAHYYLISVLAQNSFNWRERQSTVEVVDISDPQGAVRPLLAVSTKGELRERSATHIHRGSLITVSNSWVDNGQGNRIRRVTVEAFALPTPNSPVVDRSEAESRRIWFEHKMKHKPAAISDEEYAEQLHRDPEYGLKGIFIKQSDGGLGKILPDQSVSVGDSTGLHADLQDVRFVEDKLYVFWVPANQIDPLDLFDISEPMKKLHYMGRTLFDGWMERAIPFQHQGEHYLLALGWIVPATGNNALRHPQAMIFKLPSQADEKVQTVAQLTLQSSQLGSDFNDADKSITVRTRDDGSGVVIFPAYSWGDRKHLSGGKIISFDLKAAGPKIQEGGFLAADAAWLRRVFANPEIDRMHTLSDRNLSTFNLEDRQSGAADQVFEAISVLELARDIRAYALTMVAGRTYGVQLIDMEAWDSSAAQTAVRLVKPERADAEVDKTLLQKNLGGRYLSHLVSSDGQLYVLTHQQVKNMEGTEEVWSDVQKLHRVRFQLQGGVVADVLVDAVEWKTPVGYGNGFYGKMIYMPRSVQLVEQARDEILVNSGSKLILVRAGANLKLFESPEAAGCLQSAQDISYLVQDRKAYVSYAVPYVTQHPIFKDTHLVRHYLAPVDVSQLQVRCHETLNIPGRPVRVEDSRLITEEDRFLGFQEADDAMIESTPQRDIRAQPSQWAQTARVLTALKIEGGKARLHDLYSLSPAQSSWQAVGEDLVLLERSQEGAPFQLVHLRVVQDRFERRNLFLPSLPSQDVQLIAVLSPEAYKHGPLYLIRVDREGLVLQEQSKALRYVSLVTVNSRGETSKPRRSFPLLDWFGSFENNRLRVAFDPKTQRLSLAQGLWGVQQIELAR